ncbi:hypothetical protein KUV57_13100 [Epibacterium sp. DP7N7-1]|nr:hypothetical protein [Epibacterium sp. DP7N7-1]
MKQPRIIEAAMKNAKMTLTLPIGLSALALIAFQAPLSAEQLDEPGQMDQNSPASQTNDIAVDNELSVQASSDAIDPTVDEIDMPAPGGEVKDEGEKEMTSISKRNLPKSIDQISREDLERLDRLGVVGAQARIGEDILIINQHIRRAAAIKSLIGYLGVEGFRLQYPQLAAELKDSPILLEADLNKAQILADIRAANSDEKEVKPVPKPRDDGSSFFDQTSTNPPNLSPSGRPLPNGQGNTKELDPMIAALIAAEVDKATEDLVHEEALVKPSNDYVPISLREVYGLSGELHAIIIHGEERIRVRAGDKLPNDTLIQSIEPDVITILRRGQETQIRIRG